MNSFCHELSQRILLCLHMAYYRKGALAGSRPLSYSRNNLSTLTQRSANQRTIGSTLDFVVRIALCNRAGEIGIHTAACPTGC